MDSIGACDEVIHEHNYSFRADDSRNGATCTAPPSSHQSIEDAAGDPELENLANICTGVPSVPSTTPAAAWVLTTVLLLSVLQRSYSTNIIGEVAAHLAQG